MPQVRHFCQCSQHNSNPTKYGIKGDNRAIVLASMHGTVCTVKTVQTSICLGLVAQKQDGGETMAKCLCFCITKADSCLFAFTGSHSVLNAKWWRRKKNKKTHVVIKDIVIKGSGSVSDSRRYCSIPLSMKGLLWAVALSSRATATGPKSYLFLCPLRTGFKLLLSIRKKQQQKQLSG